MTSTAVIAAPRDLEVPADLADALEREPEALHCFERLSYSQQRSFVLGIAEAKRQETRQRRAEQAVERLRQGRGRR